ncbi:hypothetical protein ACBJ59_54500 [Nonomuraea sp. MTCD27]|uniref:hypothetical protein n=1 Tax=Nonomuraea sp. MTCD27 TaxID=1676747 RepID=UPI0035BF4038
MGSDLERMLLVDAGLGMTRLEWLVTLARNAPATSVAHAGFSSGVGADHPQQPQPDRIGHHLEQHDELGRLAFAERLAGDRRAAHRVLAARGEGQGGGGHAGASGPAGGSMLV